MKKFKAVVRRDKKGGFQVMEPSFEENKAIFHIINKKYNNFIIQHGEGQYLVEEEKEIKLNKKTKDNRDIILRLYRPIRVCIDKTIEYTYDRKTGTVEWKIKGFKKDYRVRSKKVKYKRKFKLYKKWEDFKFAEEHLFEDDIYIKAYKNKNKIEKFSFYYEIDMTCPIYKQKQQGDYKTYKKIYNYIFKPKIKKRLPEYIKTLKKSMLLQKNYLERKEELKLDETKKEKKKLAGELNRIYDVFNGIKVFTENTSEDGEERKEFAILIVSLDYLEKEYSYKFSSHKEKIKEIAENMEIIDQETRTGLAYAYIEYKKEENENFPTYPLISDWSDILDGNDPDDIPAYVVNTYFKIDKSLKDKIMSKVTDEIKKQIEKMIKVQVDLAKIARRYYEAYKEVKRLEEEFWKFHKKHEKEITCAGLYLINELNIEDIYADTIDYRIELLDKVNEIIQNLS